VFEIPEETDDDHESSVEETELVEWNDIRLWNYHVNVSVNHLRQRLEAVVTKNQGVY